MKKLMTKINAAIIAMMVSVPAFAAPAAGQKDGLCELIMKMQGVFKTVRVLAFVGAAFLIAGWAWGYIKAGKVDVMDELKSKGIAMVVGFVLLFGIGMMLSALTSVGGLARLGCDAIYTNW